MGITAFVFPSGKRILFFSCDVTTVPFRLNDYTYLIRLSNYYLHSPNYVCPPFILKPASPTILVSEAGGGGGEEAGGIVFQQGPWSLRTGLVRNPRCLPGACVKQHRAREARGLRISGRAADPGPAGKRTQEHRGRGGSIRLDSAEPGVPAQAPLPLQGRASGDTSTPAPAPCAHTHTWPGRPRRARPPPQGHSCCPVPARLPGKLTRRRGGESVFLGKRKEDRDMLEKSENPETAKRANLTQNSEYKWCEKPHF